MFMCVCVPMMMLMMIGTTINEDDDKKSHLSSFYTLTITKQTYIHILHITYMNLLQKRIKRRKYV